MKWISQHCLCMFFLHLLQSWQSAGHSALTYSAASATSGLHQDRGHPGLAPQYMCVSTHRSAKIDKQNVTVVSLLQVFCAQSKYTVYSGSGYYVRVNISIDGLFNQAGIKGNVEEWNWLPSYTGWFTAAKIPEEKLLWCLSQYIISRIRAECSMKLHWGNPFMDRLGNFLFLVTSIALM